MIYVCSDIHGQYKMFRAMLERINFTSEDHMYVIGDVVDRGPEPVSLLVDIMNRENVTLMIGNHEHMMIQAMLYDDADEYYNWMRNGGEVTFTQMERLDDDYVDDLLRELESCPLIIPSLSVGGRNYYLAHASHAIYPEKEILIYKDAGAQNRERILWSREYRNPDRWKLGYKYRWLYRQYPNTTLLIGHSPVHRCCYGVVNSGGYDRISRSVSGHLINLDCGCAIGNALGCLRLDDGKEFYVKGRSLYSSIWRRM